MVMAEQLIDGRVIEACQQGDRDAFRLLFETYKDKVFSIAVYSSDGDRALADDITQQIFLKLFTAIRQFRGDSEFTTWLYRLVVNACLDERRRRRRLLPWGDTVATKNPSEKRPQEKQSARPDAAETVRATRGRGRGARGERRAQAEVSFAHTVEIHRGFVIRGDRHCDGLFERHC